MNVVRVEAFVRRFRKAGSAQATRAYLAEYLAGTDVILTAFEHRECLDLSRRVQGYLLDWGQLQVGTTTDLREGARAYAGDLIIARQNDNQLDAGQPGRTLPNTSGGNRFI